MSNIPLRIKAIMKSYEWSAPKLSKRSGVPLSSIKGILHGQSNNPRAKTLESLARAFNCDTSEFELPPEAPINVQKRAVIEDVPVLQKAQEEVLVKTAINIVNQISDAKQIDLSDRDDLREVYVSKLVQFALENTKNEEDAQIDRVYASWLIGQNL